jgi:FtsZ-binding cell division protein ZapB
MDMKPFDALEEKIRRAADLLDALRKENKKLRKQATSGGADPDSLRKTCNELKSELGAMRKEKQAVRSRVETILESLDGLGLDEED